MTDKNYTSPATAEVCAQLCEGCPVASIVEAADSAFGSRAQALEAAITSQVTSEKISDEVTNAAAAVQDGLALTEAGAAIGDEASAHTMEFLERRGLLAGFEAREQQRQALKAEVTLEHTDRVESAREALNKAEDQLVRKQGLGAKAAEHCRAERPLDGEVNVAGVYLGASACRSRAPFLRGRVSFWTS